MKDWEKHVILYSYIITFQCYNNKMSFKNVVMFSVCGISSIFIVCGGGQDILN